MSAKAREQFWQGRRSLRGPAWRSLVAREITDVHCSQQTQRWDALTIALARYGTLASEGEEGLKLAAAAYPQIAAALALEQDLTKTTVAKLLTLADMPAAEAAAQIGVPSETVEVWEKLFFDVRDLRTALGWINRNVLEAERVAGRTGLAVRMKVALMAGREGALAVLALDQPGPLDEAERLLQRGLKLDLKVAEVIDMPIVTERQRAAFLKGYFATQLEERRLELAREKLAARCVAARERAALAQQRAEIAHQRTLAKSQAVHQARGERKVRGRNRPHGRQPARETNQGAASRTVTESPLAQLSWGSPPAATVTRNDAVAVRPRKPRGTPLPQPHEPAHGNRSPAMPSAPSTPPVRRAWDTEAAVGA